MTVWTLGQSEDGRPIFAHRRTGKSGPRVLVVAGQHGDEPLARAAAARLLADADLPADVTLVCNANPDGAAADRRTNARGIDLNRDHGRLRAAETVALHGYVRDWRPHLVVDVHTYPPRRRKLLARGLVFTQDVFVDGPTHPAAVLAAAAPDPLPWLVAELTASGFRAARYLRLTGGGHLRHSTLAVDDLRNGLALRHRTPTLLLEGREPTRRDPPDRGERTVAGLHTALRLAAVWAAAHHAELDRPKPPVPRVPVRCRYRRVAGAEFEFEDKSGRLVRQAPPARYYGRVETTEWADSDGGSRPLATAEGDHLNSPSGAC